MALHAEQVIGSTLARIPGMVAAGGVPARYVRFTPDPPSIFPVIAQLTEAVAVPDSVGTQIDREDIPRRTARTVWRGRNPITLRIPILLDAWQEKLSIEAATRNLDEMMGRGRSGTPREPTDLIIDAGGWVPYDARWQPDLRWWIEGIDWSDDPDDVIRRNDGHRVRQAATIQLVQVVRGAAALRATSAQNALDQLKRNSALTHTVKKGETLRSIAKHYYGDTARWEDIARLNNLSHPKVTVGRTLRLPS